MSRLSASVRFDVEAAEAHVDATVEMVVEGDDGYPVFDLRQEIHQARLDGVPLPPSALTHTDLGAGWDARARVVDVASPAGSRHTLELAYRLSTPEANEAPPITWDQSAGAVYWDLGMSDLNPGRYLEAWFPANLCHDSLAIEIAVEVVGTSRPHALLANGQVTERRAGFSWEVRYPPRYTSLSPLMTLWPVDELQVACQPGLTIAVTEGAGDAEALVADAAAWLSCFGSRYGRWAHGEEFLAVIWGSPRGMEYDGATTTVEGALEHEIFHSWFGRGVKPASARDGWMDEAMATWATASRRSAGSRFLVEELGLDEPPVVLRPRHPWSRHTPREAYAAGARLLAGVAHMAGGAPQLRSALAAWHQANAGGAASSDDLARHLGRWCGKDLTPWWERYVDGASDGSREESAAAVCGSSEAGYTGRAS